MLDQAGIMAAQSLDKNLVDIRPCPGSGDVARQVMSVAAAERAPAFLWKHNGDGTFCCGKPLADQHAERGELFGAGPHQQDFDVVLEEFPAAVALGHLADPPVGEIQAARHDDLRDAGFARTGEARLG